MAIKDDYKIKICGYFDGNFGDHILVNMVKKIFTDRGYNVLDIGKKYNGKKIGVLVGGGLADNISNNNYYFNQMIDCEYGIGFFIGVNSIYRSYVKNHLLESLDKFVYISVRDMNSYYNLLRTGYNISIDNKGYDIGFLLQDCDNIDKSNEYPVLIPVKTCWNKLESNVNFYQDIINHLDGNIRIISLHERYEKDMLNLLDIDKNFIITDYDKIIESLAKASFVINGRYHGLILSLLLNKPIINLSYNFKLNNLVNIFNIVKYEYPIGDGSNGILYPLDSNEIKYSIDNIDKFKVDYNYRIDYIRDSLNIMIDDMFNELDRLEK